MSLFHPVLVNAAIGLQGLFEKVFVVGGTIYDYYEVAPLSLVEPQTGAALPTEMAAKPVGRGKRKGRGGASNRPIKGLV